MKLPISLALFLLGLLVNGQVDDQDSFHEQLDLRPLPDGKLGATFRFLTRARLLGEQWGSNVEFFPSRLFPRSIASIVRTHGVAELHLSLVAGRWEYDRWQWPPNNGSASGAEVWAWLERQQDDVDKQWSALTNTLGGLFCASLNRLDKSHTTSPRWTFRPEGHVSIDDGGVVLRRGLLPLEKPCTENLTPFLSLLPCRASAGLAQLLKPHRLFDADWQKLSIKVTQLEGGRHELDLGVEIGFDPIRTHRMKGGEGSRDWSFQSLFDRTVNRPCPAASSSDILLHVADEKTKSIMVDSGWRPASNSDGILPITSGLSDASFPIDARLSYTFSSLMEQSFAYPLTYEPSPVSIARLILGYGQERGRIGVEILNAESHQVEAILVEEWPWWLKAYFHTLDVHVSPLFSQHTSSKPELVSSIDYTPARDRERPTLLEARLSLPPRSRIRLLLDYDKAFLRYTEYAPDANRGFDVPSASLHLPEHGKRICTTNGLISMPTPDFSMPYNVCVLTSTVVALFFGTVFNHLCRTMHLIRLDVNADVKSVSAK